MPRIQFSARATNCHPFISWWWARLRKIRVATLNRLNFRLWEIMRHHRCTRVTYLGNSAARRTSFRYSANCWSNWLSSKSPTLVVGSFCSKSRPKDANSSCRRLSPTDESYRTRFAASASCRGTCICSRSSRAAVHCSMYAV